MRNSHRAVKSVNKTAIAANVLNSRFDIRYSVTMDGRTEGQNCLIYQTYMHCLAKQNQSYTQTDHPRFGQLGARCH